MKQLRNNFMTQSKDTSGGMANYFPPPKGARPKALAPIADPSMSFLNDNSTKVPQSMKSAARPPRPWQKNMATPSGSAAAALA